MAIQFKRGTSSTLSNKNPSISYGQPVLEVSTSSQRSIKLKIGYNTSNTAYNSLRYLWLVPVGTIVMFGGGSVPDNNWLLCNGAAVSRTTYADLFSVIGTTYGSGNGSSTFNVPSLKGRFPVGSMGLNDLNTTNYWGTVVNDGSYNQGNLPLGERGGTYFHVLTMDQMPRHRHALTWKSAGSGGLATGIIYNGTATNTIGQDGSPVSYEGQSGPHTNMPPYTSLTFIIKAY